MMLRRRFVDLVATTTINLRNAYTRHRIDLSGLFYPRKPQAAAAALEIEEAQLPPPVMTFFPCPNICATGTVGFMPLGRSNEDIVTVDQDGRALLYGASSHAVQILPPLHKAKYNPISLTVGGSLYVMKSYPADTSSHFFEALVHGHRPDIPCDYPAPRWDWHWHSLPSPPFAAHDPHRSIYEGYDESLEVAAYTVVNGSEIWVTQRGKTYSFDTVSCVWSTVGDWTLPFRGHAEYVPEHRLWFGVSSSGDDLLCASDLLSSGGGCTPRQRGVWMWEDRAPPIGWFPLESSYLVHLGMGSFCIAKLFKTGRTSSIHYDKLFVVLTCVEVERCGEELRMVKHGSRRYTLDRPSYYHRVF